MAWDCGAGHYFGLLLRRCLVLKIFPFPVGKVKLTGKFYNNRQSAVNSYPRFAYSFVSLMLRQYYWSCDLYSANRRSAASKKKSPKTSYWRCQFAPLRLRAQLTFHASPISARCHAVPLYKLCRL
jgi:hypothetical protein